MTVLSFDEVVKEYRSKNKSTLAVDGFSVDIKDGEFITVVGPSGCGKSTLLKLIMGFEELTAGSIRYTAETGDSRQPLGTVFQQALLLPWKNTLENVLVPSMLEGRKRESEDAERARELLRMLGLEEFETSYPHELSGGMQQRVGIARALLHDPRILLMDEPFGALDAMTRDELTMELLGIWERYRKTVLFITHSISEAVLLSDRVVVMTPRPGRIADVVDVDIPRPRSLETMNTAKFGEIAAHIRGLLDSAEEATA